MTDARITSVKNARIKQAAALQRKKERDATGRYLVEGPNAVRDALEAGVVETVYATGELVGDYGGAPVEVVEVDDHVLERLATTRTPQGVVAVARQRDARLEEVVGHGFLVACDRISDPGNLGTVIRTAEAAGAAGVVLTPGSVDAHNPKAVRASAGAVTRLPVVPDVRLADLAVSCRGAGQRVLALDTSGDRSIDTPELLSPPVALVFGSEAHGLSGEDLGQMDAVVAIPRYGRAESLNLAAAVAVAAYAAARLVHGDREPS